MYSAFIQTCPTVQYVWKSYKNRIPHALSNIFLLLYNPKILCTQLVPGFGYIGPLAFPSDLRMKNADKNIHISNTSTKIQLRIKVVYQGFRGSLF